MSERVEKTWGFEEILWNGAYCAKRLVYTRKIASSLHYHERKHETFVIAEGVFDVEVDGKKQRMGPGSHVVIPPNTPHRVRSISTGYIVEASTHDDPEDCVRIEPSET